LSSCECELDAIACAVGGITAPPQMLATIGPDEHEVRRTTTDAAHQPPELVDQPVVPGAQQYE